MAHQKPQVNPSPPERLIWATAGRSWGFRFLLAGGLSDPLPTYERIFADVEEEPSACRRAAGSVALRIPDPMGRRDSAGRVISHEFVVSGEMANEIGSVKDGLEQVWPLVAEAYARVWDADGAPTAADLRFTTHRSPRTTEGDDGDR